MCYRCSCCNEAVGDKTPLIKHIEYREVEKDIWKKGKTTSDKDKDRWEKTKVKCKEVAGEYPVCHRCSYLLSLGYSYRGLKKKWNREQEREEINRKLEEEGVKIGPGTISVEGQPVGTFLEMRLVKDKRRKGGSQ